MVDVSIKTFFHSTLIINLTFVSPILSILSVSGLINFQNTLFPFFYHRNPYSGSSLMVYGKR